MQSGLINSPARSMPAKAMMPMINGRPDYQLADALTKVPPLGDGDRFRAESATVVRYLVLQNSRPNIQPRPTCRRRKISGNWGVPRIIDYR